MDPLQPQKRYTKGTRSKADVEERWGKEVHINVHIGGVRSSKSFGQIQTSEWRVGLKAVHAVHPRHLSVWLRSASCIWSKAHGMYNPYILIESPIQCVKAQGPPSVNRCLQKVRHHNINFIVSIRLDTWKQFWIWQYTTSYMWEILHRHYKWHVDNSGFQTKICIPASKCTAVHRKIRRRLVLRH